jgi:hypothetical protein
MMGDELSWDERQEVEDEEVSYDSPFDEMDYPGAFM